MPAGDAPKGEVNLSITEPWRRENARMLRNAVSRVIVKGQVGDGNYPDHPAPFTPEEAANICIDQCYLEAPDGAELAIEGYGSK
jgi:hypothetical protein